MENYAPRPGAGYVGTTGAIFTAVGGLVLWAFWRRKHWAPLAFLGAALIYAVWFWADRLLVQIQTSPNWPFDLSASIVLLGFAAGVALDPRNTRYFGKEAHERELENPPTA